LCDAEQITRRMWRAQVTVFFWLETPRTEFVLQHQGRLRASTRISLRFKDTSELERAEFRRLARQSLPSGEPRRRLAENSREMRNALAHMQAVDFEMYHRLN
jgi:hypothetical protein